LHLVDLAFAQLFVVLLVELHLWLSSQLTFFLRWDEIEFALAGVSLLHSYSPVGLAFFFVVLVCSLEEHIVDLLLSGLLAEVADRYGCESLLFELQLGAFVVSFDVLEHGHSALDDVGVYLQLFLHDLRGDVFDSTCHDLECILDLLLWD